ncbi:hypothetical protein TUMEXPCC7403_12680 [Tumidithrix helvetica PCC 7403]
MWAIAKQRLQQHQRTNSQPPSKPRSNWQKLFSLAFAIALCFYLTACGGDKPSNVKKSTVQGAGVTEVSPPIEIQRLSRFLDRYEPQVAIVSPKPDTVLDSTTVTVKFDVKDLPIFKNATFGMGPHVHVALDGQEYKALYDLNQAVTFENLLPGTHTIRAFASRPWHESFKNEGAYTQTTFHVFTKTGENTPSPQVPLLTYSRPVGTYGAEPIMLDFYLRNAPLHLVALEDDTVSDWQIRATLNGQSFTFDQWQPIYLKGFKPGKNWVKLELLDSTGKLIPNAFNSSAHAIDYQPNGSDTLARLMRGEAIASIEKIVDPNYVPPAPPVEPAIVPPVVVPVVPAIEPSVAPAPASTPEPKAEVKSEAKPEPKAEVKPEPKAEVKPEPKAEVKPEPKAEVKPEPKLEPKAEPKAEVKPEPAPSPTSEPVVVPPVVVPPVVTPAPSDKLKEPEVKKPEAKKRRFIPSFSSPKQAPTATDFKKAIESKEVPVSKPQLPIVKKEPIAKPQPPVVKDEPKADSKVDLKSETKVEPKVEPKKVEPKVEPQAEPKAESKQAPKQEVKVKEAPVVQPSLTASPTSKPSFFDRFRPKEAPKVVEPKKPESPVSKPQPSAVKDEPKVEPTQAPKAVKAKESPVVQPSPSASPSHKQSILEKYSKKENTQPVQPKPYLAPPQQVQQPISKFVPLQEKLKQQKEEAEKPSEDLAPSISGTSKPIKLR